MFLESLSAEKTGTKYTSTKKNEHKTHEYKKPKILKFETQEYKKQSTKNTHTEKWILGFYGIKRNMITQHGRTVNALVCWPMVPGSSLSLGKISTLKTVIQLQGLQ